MRFGQMTKGHAAFGKKQKRTHKICRRCGKHAFHLSNKSCGYCGFGRTSKLRTWNWKSKSFMKKVKL